MINADDSCNVGNVRACCPIDIGGNQDHVHGDEVNIFVDRVAQISFLSFGTIQLVTQWSALLCCSIGGWVE